MGRKSFKEELSIKQRYSDLSGPFFAFLKECFEGSNKIDKKWAAEQLSKAFTKMLPQEISGVDGKPIPILMHMNVPTHNSNPEDSPAQKAN